MEVRKNGSEKQEDLLGIRIFETSCWLVSSAGILLPEVCMLSTVF
jgi:hypothetical protein